MYSVLLNFDADGGKISVGQIPPMPSEVGMLWFSTNEEELTLFIYVDDESGWVPLRRQSAWTVSIPQLPALMSSC